jgi:hypothetical protein
MSSLFGILAFKIEIELINETWFFFLFIFLFIFDTFFFCFFPRFNKKFVSFGNYGLKNEVKPNFIWQEDW